MTIKITPYITSENNYGHPREQGYQGLKGWSSGLRKIGHGPSDFLKRSPKAFAVKCNLRIPNSGWSLANLTFPFDVLLWKNSNIYKCRETITLKAPPSVIELQQWSVMFHVYIYPPPVSFWSEYTPGTVYSTHIQLGTFFYNFLHNHNTVIPLKN